MTTPLYWLRYTRDGRAVVIAAAKQPTGRNFDGPFTSRAEALEHAARVRAGEKIAARTATTQTLEVGRTECELPTRKQLRELSRANYSANGGYDRLLAAVKTGGAR